MELREVSCRCLLSQSTYLCHWCWQPLKWMLHGFVHSVEWWKSFLVAPVSKGCEWRLKAVFTFMYIYKGSWATRLSGLQLKLSHLQLLIKATQSYFPVSGPTSHLKMTRPPVFFCFSFLPETKVERKCCTNSKMHCGGWGLETRLEPIMIIFFTAITRVFLTYTYSSAHMHLRWQTVWWTKSDFLGLLYKGNLDVKRRK